jgi:RNA polymerase-binding transcription factor DksA
MTDIATRKAMLLERYDRLDKRIRAIEEELEGHESRDWSELAQEREGDEVLERQGTASQTEMAAIRAALRRIEEGTYGVCVRCGDEIASERLDLLPHAPLCADCARGRSG